MGAADPELIRTYVQQGSHEAFAALVQRHIDLVYAAARRQLRSQHLVEEATQLAFVALAQNAPKLDGSAAPWLIGLTRRIALDLLKREGRRPSREQPAFEAGAPNAPAAWARIEPVLDEAIGALGKDDSTALLLRYFETKNLREIAGALGTTDVAAQKRIGHALDELRAILRRRGVDITSADLSANLAAYGIEMAPAALTHAVTANALGGRAAAAVLPAAAVGLAGWEKVVIISAAVLGAGGMAFEAVTLWRAHATTVELRNENADLLKRVRDAEDQRRAAVLAADGGEPVRPAGATAGGRPNPAPTQPVKRPAP